MILNRKFDPLRCTSTDLLRPAINDVFFDGKYLISTNGHIACFLPVEKSEKDRPNVLIKRDFFKMLNSNTPKNLSDYPEFKTEGIYTSCDMHNITLRYANSKENFPDVKKAMRSLLHGDNGYPMSLVKEFLDMCIKAMGVGKRDNINIIELPSRQAVIVTTRGEGERLRAQYGNPFCVVMYNMMNSLEADDFSNFFVSEMEA